ncbi:MAG: hypothetical protein GXY83_17255 [Rhodopirellula sp.]|nr:hypothetical protein [Rhodopirellula sp.]
MPLETDARFALLRNRDGAMIVGGTELKVESAQGDLRIAADKPCTVSAVRKNGIVTVKSCGNIQYDTYGGANHDRPLPQASATIQGSLWRNDHPQR